MKLSGISLSEFSQIQIIGRSNSALIPNKKMFKQFILLIILHVILSNEIIALGDIHGDYEKVIDMLTISKLISSGQNPEWTGGKRTLIQIGDILDRGKNGSEILFLFQKLQKEAHFAGGKVILLLGNHVRINF